MTVNADNNHRCTIIYNILQLYQAFVKHLNASKSVRVKDNLVCEITVLRIFRYLYFTQHCIFIVFIFSELSPPSFHTNFYSYHLQNKLIALS